MIHGRRELVPSETWRASPVVTTIPSCIDSAPCLLGFGFSLRLMPRRRKKALPLVLGHDSSHPDLEISSSLEPLEEEHELSPEDDCHSPLHEALEVTSEEGGCPSPTRDATDLEASIDDVVAELEPYSGIPHLPDDLGLPNSMSVHDLNQGLPQVNPNSSKSLLDMCPLTQTTSNGRDSSLDLMLNTSDVGEFPHLRENDASTSHSTGGPYSALKCIKLHLKSSSADPSHHIWKPRNRKKQTSWQRVPVQSKKSHAETEPTPHVANEQTCLNPASSPRVANKQACPNPDPPPQAANEVEIDNSNLAMNRDPLITDSSIPGCSSSAQASI
ncbi:hypothetical protein Dimus_013932 [Dionaea muscipula]